MNRTSDLFDRILNTGAAWALALLWVLPLAYAVWTAFHPAAYEARFELFAPLTLENFGKAWEAAPFARYFLNTFILVTMILAGQFFLCTLAAFAFARFEFPGRNILFALVLLQLLVMPDILGRKLQDHAASQSSRYDPGDRATLYRLRIRYLPVAPNVHDDPEGTG